jgi:GTP-binding protein
MLMSIEEQKDGRQLMTLKVPTRGMLGFRNMLTTETKGTAQLRSQYLEHDEPAGEIKKLHKGALIQCVGQGNATAYSLKKIAEKGTLFVGPNTPVYEGMVIGEHVLSADMEMNAVKAKATTNIRVTGATGVDEKLAMHKTMALEEAIAYIRDDELVEVTPKHIRMRKRTLSQSQRGTMTRRQNSSKR